MSPKPESSRKRSRNRRSSLRYRQRAGQSCESPYEMDIPDLPNIPRIAPAYVRSADQLSVLVDRLRAAGSFAYDSEFIGELSYYPKLCLLQVATTDHIAVIDPLSESLDLTAFWRLIADPGIRTIVHCGLQDLEPVVRLTDFEPANVFDTQIAAGFIGLAHPLALGKLVDWAFGVKLPKGSTFTIWDRRPLSDSQIAYAADDVRYLPAIAMRLDDELAGRGHALWCEEECTDILCDKRRYRFDLQSAIKRIRGSGGLKSHEQVLLQRLVQWRDRAAREQDVPPRSMLKDELLMRLTYKQPTCLTALKQIKDIPRPVREDYGEQICDLVRETPAPQAGVSSRKSRPRPSMPDRQVIDAFVSIVNAYCYGRQIDPKLVCVRQELTDYLRSALGGDDAFLSTLRLCRGWRQAFIGEFLESFLAGHQRVTVEWQDNHLAVQPPDEPQADRLLLRD